MDKPTPIEWWSFLWKVGLLLGFVGVPAVLGFLAGSRLEESGAMLPWRLMFVAIGVAVGSASAWFLCFRPRRSSLR